MKRLNAPDPLILLFARLGVAFLLASIVLGVGLLSGEIDFSKSIHQPPIEEDLLCYDYATGNVYKCFTREDGNIQLRINPEGNLVIARTIETEEYKKIVEEQQK